MFRKLNVSTSTLLEKMSLDTIVYFQENIYLINVLIVGMIVAYGFELFNLNLTIDEEIHAFYNGPTSAWVAQGRWGMYVLNKFLLPYTVVPVVPLFLTLVFHLISTLLMLDAWNIKLKLDRVVLGMLGVTFPTLAFAYTFSTANFGIGFGYLCIASSIFIYTRNAGWAKFVAVVPATFSLAIYQGFIPALISIFLVHIISLMLSEKPVMKDVIFVSFIVICAMIAYYVTQKLAIILLHITESGYISQYLNMEALFDDFIKLFNRLLGTAMDVYFGDKSIYSTNIPMLGVLFMTFLFGVIWRLLNSKASFVGKISIFFLVACLLILPFSLGIFSGGSMAMRVAVALPIVVSGFGMLGMGINTKLFKLFITLIAGFCFLQFIVSTNHLFASSYLSLQEDRLLAAHLIDEIQEAKETAGITDTKYLHIIGYVNRPANELIPKIETFGASFFEWNQGSAGRIVMFLNSIGYFELNLLPSNRLVEMIQVAATMPQWPEKGSVKVVGDTVLVKFGPYSYPQIIYICDSTQNRDLIPSGFCP